jgi:hypothetical protein
MRKSTADKEENVLLQTIKLGWCEFAMIAGCYNRQRS